MERWQGRVALVTGASVGIGKAICHKLVENGLIVVGCARNIEKLKAIAEEDVVKSARGSFLPIQCDLAKESDILSMFEEIRSKYGKIDVCINNAGLGEVAPLMSGSTSQWELMLNVNVLALSICTREAIKLMKEADVSDGQIIQISSMSGHRIPSTSLGFYAGTKFMVRALAEVLRQELRADNSHIRVACVSPGLVETEFATRAYRESPDVSKNMYSSITCLQSEDIADVVIAILQTPPHVDINDILIRPTEQKM